METSDYNAYPALKLGNLIAKRPDFAQEVALWTIRVVEEEGPINAKECVQGAARALAAFRQSVAPVAKEEPSIDSIPDECVRSIAAHEHRSIRQLTPEQTERMARLAELRNNPNRKGPIMRTKVTI